ncbi:hypothetical protein C8054_10960 [Micromonospora sp. RP3T]|nr:hypothetical protein C8054_10960 [Micromonospora sp. RP3T]
MANASSAIAEAITIVMRAVAAMREKSSVSFAKPIPAAVNNAADQTGKASGESPDISAPP